jgi:capsular exopolysaccharide synthesis family protein
VELKDYLAVLVRRWRIVAAVTLLGVIGGIVVGFAMPASYTAEAQLFVSGGKTASSPSQLYQSGDFYQQRAQTYADLATSPRVTVPVLKRTGAPLTADELAEKISAQAPENTVLVDIDVKDASAGRAARLANAVAGRLGAVIQKIETPPGKQVSPVKATVARQASPPQSADAPGTGLIVVLGLIIGVVLGIGVAVVRESMDTSVKSAEDLQGAAGLPALATVRRDPAAKSQPIIQGGAAGARPESFRQLRTNLQYADIDHRPRTILVTSAVAGEGKTSVAGSLAVTMARQGRSVCLIDGDLRQPKVAEYLGVVGEVGLTTVLVERAALREVLQPAAADLAVLTSGAVPPNPSELLGTERMSRVLDDLAANYDTVLIDTPPVLPVTDAAVLARAVDGVIMVVRSGKTTRTQLAEAAAELRNVGVRVLGGVLNMAPSARGKAYGYGYGYGAAARVATESSESSSPTQPEQDSHDDETAASPATSPETASNGAREWRKASRTDRLDPVKRP